MSNQAQSTNLSQMSAKAKRIPRESISLSFAGELILPRIEDRELAGMFRRYQALFECFANMDRDERMLNYKLINGLMLTSYAKKTSDDTEKKKLFSLKNDIFVDLANNRDSRRKCAFKYLVSKNFRVLKFCDDCVKKNTAAGLEKHKWRYCDKCDVDRNFFNVLSMHHKFADGSSTLFLSNDQLDRLEGISLKNRGNLKDFDEEARYEKYHYNVRNLDAFKLNDVIKMHEKLLT